MGGGDGGSIVVDWDKSDGDISALGRVAGWRGKWRGVGEEEERGG